MNKPLTLQDAREVVNTLNKITEQKVESFAKIMEKFGHKDIADNVRKKGIPKYALRKQIHMKVEELIGMFCKIAHNDFVDRGDIIFSWLDTFDLHFPPTEKEGREIMIIRTLPPPPKESNNN